jgi:prophage regulatory protein
VSSLAACLAITSIPSSSDRAARAGEGGVGPHAGRRWTGYRRERAGTLVDLGEVLGRLEHSTRARQLGASLKAQSSLLDELVARDDSPKKRNRELPTDPNAVLSIEQVVALLSISKSTIQRMVRKRQFPEPIKLSARRIGWRRTDIEAWQERGKAKTRQQSVPSEISTAAIASRAHVAVPPARNG